MKTLLVLLPAACAALPAGCGGSPPATPADPPAASAADSGIAALVLDTPQHEDFLYSSRQAMASVSASDVAEFAHRQPLLPEMALSAASDAGQAASAANLPPLPAECGLYFQRAEQCFARQGEFAAELHQMTAEARADIVHGRPDAAACQELNRSFDAVARNLGCE